MENVNHRVKQRVGLCTKSTNFFQLCQYELTVSAVRNSRMIKATSWEIHANKSTGNGHTFY